MASKPKSIPIYRSLSVRLLLPLLAIIVVVLVSYALLTVQSTKGKWTQLMYDSADRTSELIKRATHYGMLSNRKEDVHHTIRKIAAGPGVAGIRVYDKEGRIIFSANAAEIGKKVDANAQACVLCHEKGAALRSPSMEQRVREFQSPQGQRILGLINPIENEPRCANSSCHADPADQTILGVLDVQLSMDYMAKTLARTQAQLVWGALLITVILSFALIVFVNRIVRRPVQRLHEGTERIARGDLSVRVAASSQDELGRLGDAFNTMTEDLCSAREELTEWSQVLERKVVEKTEALGRLHRRSLQIEKMASLGKLAATVAHELNNPLAGILTYAKLVQREMGRDEPSPTLGEDTQRYLSLIQRESARCGKIVQNLLLFAHPSGGQMAPVPINEVIQRCVMLIHHHLEMNAIELSVELVEGDDLVKADGGQIQQALLALLINAVEAMSDDGRGQLAIRCNKNDDVLCIDVKDSGRGIADEAKASIFEPFYSTKDDEQGVGLGLSVVYGIIQRHRGVIDCQSEVGCGTTFHLEIPLQSETQDGCEKGLAQQSVFVRRR